MKNFSALIKLGNAPLHLRPWQHRFTINPGDSNPQGLGGICAILTSKPCGGVPFPAMSFHVPHHSVFAVDAAIPFLQGFINIGLGKFPARGFWVQLSHGITVSLTVLTNGGNGHMEPITQLLGSFFQLMCRDAAHIHSAASRDWAGAEVQIQHRGGLLGVFPIDFKEIPNLIQHNILRVGRLNFVVLPDSRIGFLLNRLGGFYRLCFLGFRLLFRKLAVNDFLRIIPLFQFLRGANRPDSIRAS